MVTSILLVALAVGGRLLSAEYHYWNLVPVGAVALFAGSRLPRRWAWIVPLAAMVLSDMVIDDYGRHRPVFDLTRWTIYGTLALTTWMGWIANSPKFRLWMVPALSVVGSSVFFLTTNLATWAEGLLYPLSWSGLIICYIEAIPFHERTFVAELIGTCVLFGVAPVIERAAVRIGLRGAGAKAKAADLGDLA